MIRKGGGSLIILSIKVVKRAAFYFELKINIR
jgi:hypothetical protein